MTRETQVPVIEYDSQGRQASCNSLLIVSWLLLLLQILWFYGGVLASFFDGPAFLHYALYDYLPLRLVAFAGMGLPSFVSFAICIHLLRHHRRYRVGLFEVGLCVGCMSIVLCFAIWLFGLTVIHPSNPRAPGYWL